VFGIVVGVLLVASAVVRPAVADPSVTGLVWGGLLGAFVLGTLWPLLAVRVVGLRIVHAPTDLVVGQLGTLELELAGRASGLVVGATGSGTAVIDATAPGRLRIPFTVAARGAYASVRIDLGSDAPFGVAHAVRSRVVALPHQLLVGPEPLEQPVTPGPLPIDLSQPESAGASPSGDSVRSVRPYVTGDPAHLVHWPSTARTGTLVVRELEPPAALGVALVVHLGDGTLPPSVVEPVAARAAGAAGEALERGARVLLCTIEASGPVVAECADRLAVQRRLALACTGPTPHPPEGWPVLRLEAPAVSEPGT
jgi:uncharacterized protein (DUF58 family)